MLSQKPRRRMSSPTPASRVVDRARAAVADRRGRARAAVADRRGRATEPRARGRRRTAARGLLNARLRECDAAVEASGARRRPGGRETFPPSKPLKTKETELESRRIRLGSEDADATAATVSPNRKESRRRVHPRRRSREIGREADTGRRNFPIRNPLKRLETGKKSGKPSLSRAGSSLRSGECCLCHPAPEPPAPARCPTRSFIVRPVGYGGASSRSAGAFARLIQ